MQETPFIQGFELSPQQRRLWSLRRTGGPGGFWAQIAVAAGIPLDADALREAVNAVVARHEILRTRFEVLPAMTWPVQVVADSWEILLEDGAAPGGEPSREWLDEILAAQRAKAAGATGGPVLRTAVLPLDGSRRLLVFTLPALCADRRTLRNLVREIEHAYTRGGAEPLDGEPVQYADIAAVFGELLESPDTEAGRRYWLEQALAPATQAGEFSPGSLQVDLALPLLSGVRDALERCGASPFDFFLACWAALLWHREGRAGVVIGAELDGRSYEGLPEAMGLFSRYLPIAPPLARGRKLAEVAADVRQAVERAAERQDYFSWPGDEAAPPFFPFCFELQPERPEQKDASFAILRERARFDRFGLLLECGGTHGGWSFEIHYDTALYERSGVERVAGAFQALLESVARDPESTVGDLEAVGAGERLFLVTGLNETRMDHGPETCLHRLFEAQAERTPERVAALFEDREATFRELDEHANRLAHRLRGLGVSRGTRVGLACESSLDLIAVLLAVLKAGAAYVPLDPSHPGERLAYVCQDAGLGLLIKDGHLLPGMPDLGIRTVTLGQLLEESAGERGERPEEGTTRDDLAYVIYTSGSTGRPKGVMVSHGAICNRLLWMQRVLPAGMEDRIAQKTPLSFDASIWELFVPLFTGATLVLARSGGHQDPAYLTRLVAERGVTILQLVPSMLQVVLDEPGFQDCRTLRRVFCGGEALPRSTVERFQARLDAELHNLYGPTESSIDASSWSGGPRSGSDLVPIGRPIDNVCLYVLSEDLRLVPFGAAGELFIGGAGLAMGYSGLPGLTAERFLPDPFAAEPGARLYRTGDRVRYLSDGALEFLGRQDDQVKLRGNRIELGEVEAVLSQHPAVAQAVAAVRTDARGDQRLVAYVVPRREPGGELVADDLRRFAESRLPGPMMPSAFVHLEGLPRLPNGKVDRKSLPELEPGAAVPKPPLASPTQELLANVWKEVLGVQEIGPSDHFLELGGHSLLAMRVIARLREAGSVQVSVRQLFESPRLADFAAVIEAAIRGEETAAPAIEPAPREGDLPLSFPQQRLFLLDQLESGGAGAAAYNVPMAARLTGRLDGEALTRTFEEIVRRHESLRATFHPGPEGPVQRISAQSPPFLSRIDLSNLEPRRGLRELERLAAREASRPFDLSRGPLLRVVLVRLGEDVHELLVTMHHIASDGWSTGVLIQEIGALYDAFRQGQPPPLPELPIQYSDFAVWQNRWLQGEVLENLLAYWRRRLAGVPRLALPLDRPRPATETDSGSGLVAHLPRELGEKLGQLTREEGCTLFMTLLAGYQVLLGRWADQEDVAVGTDVANRSRSEVEGLIGFFVNLLVLRTSLGGRPSFRQVMRRVREVTLEAYAHQDLPFEKLVEELRPERKLGVTPFVQALFVLQNVPLEKLELSGLTLTKPAGVSTGTAKFDLALFVTEAPEGLITGWNYKTDLFEPETIARLARSYETLLAGAVANPDRPIDELEMVSGSERKRQAMEKNLQKEAKLHALLSVVPKAAAIAPRALVQTELPAEGRGLPLIVRPASPEVDLADWTRNNRDFIERSLGRHGALLFRDFGVRSVERFEQFASALCPDLFGEYGDLPTEEGGRKVYKSTPYPADKWILFHNESSHMPSWPLRQFFFCVQAAPQGGETPLLDCRETYRRIDPAILDRFRKKKLMYVRNFVEGVDVSWQDFFKTDDRGVVEERCRASQIELEWRPDGSLRTRQIAPAIARHPKTGELVFFNQIQLHHSSCLDEEVRRSMLSLFPDPADLPRNVFYGDGTPIEDSVVDEIGALYREACVAAPWQDGDVILVDNMLVAHARMPFSGPRKIVVAMAEMIHRAGIGEA